MKSRYTTPSGDRYTLYADMLRQKHLLIAGKTGSGKSVVINSLIYTALYQMPGDGAGAVSFILIDPKRVELAKYKNLPHTLAHATEPQQIRDALTLALRITDSRYKRMEREGTELYNGSDLYVIIDEFADLMTTQKRLIMPVVQRLAQIGRAARVHIILATQTPIAKVLPTEIKCNFDSVVGLSTRSAQDSRNILGKTGLETLPEYGYCIYNTPKGAKMYQIPMYDRETLLERVKWWTDQDASALTKLFRSLRKR